MKQPCTSHSIELEVDILYYQWKTQKLRTGTEDFSIAEQKYHTQHPLETYGVTIVLCPFFYLGKLKKKKIKTKPLSSHWTYMYTTYRAKQKYELAAFV